jgi:hypothetical protein
LSTKLSIARKIFNLEKDKVLNSSSFKQFLSENEVHSLPFRLSCVIMVLDFLFQTVCDKLSHCILIGMVETICGILLFAGLF